MNLGNVRSHQGLAGEAENAYRRALTLVPDDVDALNNLAWLLLEGGSALEEAETLARFAAAQAGPDRTFVLDTLARILSARGACDEAEATVQEALALPGLPPDQRGALEKTRDELHRDCRAPF